MKAFLLSAIAFLLLCAIVVINSLFVSGVSRDMRDALIEIKSSPSESTLEELENIWNKNKIWISLSVPHKQTDELERQLLLLKAGVGRGEGELDDVIILLSRAIDEIKTHGMASLDNIL